MAEHEKESILDVVQKLLRRDPFVPFSIHLASGEKYLIEHPYSVAMNESYLFYCLPRSYTVYMRLNQIVSIQDPMEQSAA